MRLTADVDSFRYSEERDVLRDVSFSLEKGETMVIVGASGCGKSTLLRLTSGILPKQREHVLKGEIDVFGQTPDAYRTTGDLSFMFQEATLMPNRTVRENIWMPLEIRGRRHPERVDELLDTVGLADFEDYMPGALSGGMKTRVALARSFVTEPELLLLDEPFAALDLTWKTELYGSLRNLVERFDTSIIMVTHDLQEAVYNANKVMVLGQAGTNLDMLHIDQPFPRPFDFGETVAELTEELRYLAKLLTDDAVRKTTSREEALAIIEKLEALPGSHATTSEQLTNWTMKIREHTNDPEINQRLLAIWDDHPEDELLRFNVVWNILNFENLPQHRHRAIADWTGKRLWTFAESIFPFYRTDRSKLLTALKQRINSVDQPDSKKWIYLCNVPASSDKEGARHLLQEVIEGKNSHLDYALAKEVAREVLDAIEKGKTADHEEANRVLAA